MENRQKITIVGVTQNNNTPQMQILNVSRANDLLLKRETAITRETIGLYPEPEERHERRIKSPFKISPVDLTNAKNKTAKEKKVREELAQKYETKVQIIVDTINSETQSKEEKLECLYNWFLENVFYWDNYPRGINGVRGTEYFVEEDGISYSYPYNDKECAVVKGFSLCRGISYAFQDIASRLGIDIECISNANHCWNMVYTDNGPLYIDVSQGVRHFKSDTPEKRLFNKKEAIDQRKADGSYLKTITELYNMYPHSNGVVSEDEYRTHYESMKLSTGYARK